MARRELQEINAGSMADIAFLLLIFFLVSTTIDTDSGILRRLPPPPEENPEDIEVKERNVFVVLVNRNDQLLVEGEQMEVKDLRKAAKEFIANPQRRDDMPAVEQRDFPYFGTMNVTPKHVISLMNDRGTSYKTYIAVTNELVAAYNELRDELAVRKFGKKYTDMKGEDWKDIKDVIEDVYPGKISEAEPNKVGG